ncbi:protein late bloomer [Drosophila eugracilis]|uniref:protein late bloomer n=1 Tax=Drosophila eugracilis TaxID=29029 RepID=UPI0007E624BE|nr:protein late bloomer [Drosophila eugracilis]
MGWTSGCVKCFLNTLNTLNALSGLSLIAIATLALSKAPLAYIVFLYGLGGIIFVSAILGCCGICQENVCMTATYGFLLLGQLIISLLGIFGFRFSEEYIEKFAAEEVQMKWNEELVAPGAMDIYQQVYECCGRDSPDDYVAIGRKTLPSSCYPHSDTQKLHYTTGCVQKSSQNFVTIFNYANDTNWVAVGITVLMVIAAFYLVGRFRKQRIRYSY